MKNILLCTVAMALLSFPIVVSGQAHNLVGGVKFMPYPMVEAVSGALFNHIAAHPGVSPCGMPGTIFVDDDAMGANDGTSWGDAFTGLQQALSVAVPGSEIWVKEGFYTPTQTADRSIRFELLAGVYLYGGFSQEADCETPFYMRDPALFETILSGNIGDAGLVTDNSYCVVRAYNVGVDAVVDGFVISDGNTTVNTRPATVVISASGNGLESSPHFDNCVFRDNINPSFGGALYIRAIDGSMSAPTFSNCSFLNNSAANYGGAVYLSVKTGATLYPMFSNCSFMDNTVSGSGNGGAVAQLVEAFCSSYLTFYACTFSGQHVTGNGGAVWSNTLKSSATMDFFNSTFNNNSAVSGGGIYQKGATSDAHLNITECTFDGNGASAEGGGLYVYGDKSNLDNVTVRRTMFCNNLSSRGGGAFLYNLGDGCLGTGYFENCIFYNNNASTYGGALGVWARSLGHYDTNLQSCTLHSNDAGTHGSAVSNYITNAGSISNLHAHSCIVWGNPAATGASFYTANPGATTTYNTGILDCAIGAANNTGTGSFQCAGMVAADPMFVDSATNDLRLQAGSLAIDACGQGVPEDFDNGERPLGNGYDMGAFEYDAILPRLGAQNPAVISPLATLNMALLPNPTSGNFLVIFDREEDGVVEVVDLHGRVIQSASLQGNTQVEMNLFGHSSGTYLIRVTTVERSMVSKLQLL